MLETLKKAFTFFAIFSVIATPIYPPIGGFADDQVSPNNSVNEIFLPSTTTSVTSSVSQGYWQNLTISQDFGSDGIEDLSTFSLQNSTFLSLSELATSTQSTSTEEIPPSQSQIASTTLLDLTNPTITPEDNASSTSPSQSQAAISAPQIIAQDDQAEMATGTSLLGADAQPPSQTAEDGNSTQQSTTTAAAIPAPSGDGSNQTGQAILGSSTTTVDSSDNATTTTLQATSSSPEIDSTSTDSSGFEANSQATTTVNTVSANTPSVQIPDDAFSPQTGPINQPVSPDLEYSGFQAQGGGMASSTVIDATVKVSLAGIQNPGAALEFEYSFSGSDWQSLGYVNLSNSQSPQINNGYFVFKLPRRAAKNLDTLSIKLSYVGQQSLQTAMVFIKDLWVEANFNIATPDSPDDDLAPQMPTASSTFSTLDFQNQLVDMVMPGDLTNPISISRKGSQPFLMSIKGVSKNSTPLRNGNNVTYQDAFPSTDLQYQLTQSGLKENIILKDQSHPAVFKYAVDSDNYDIQQISSNVIDFYQKGRFGQPLYKFYTLSAPLMTDANGQTSSSLSWQVKHNSIILTPDSAWLKTAVYPVTIDPDVEINILNVSSFPVTGEDWTIDFTTIGTADLTVTPADQDTINDMSFVSLTCGGSPVVPAVDPVTGIVTAPSWFCDNGVGEIKFLDHKTGHHHMVFNFGGVTEDAYNGSNVWNGDAGDGKWETPGNWSTGVAPTPSDDVVINTAATVNIATGTTVDSLTIGNSGGGTASILNFNYNAIGSSSPLTTVGGLTVYSGASITHTAGTSAVVGTINLSVGGSATITGSITADGKGYSTQNGPGSDGTHQAGASYGGSGGTGNDGSVASSTYDSLADPTSLGSGGYAGACGGLPTGGGAIKLTVTGTTTINSSGIITASAGGTTGCDSSGGSGGSIYLTTNALAGSGNIEAYGGAHGNWNFTGDGGGGGGGGRIAVYYTTDNSTITYQNYGGNGATYSGGAGTTFRKAASETYGDLTYDNNNINGSSWNTFTEDSLGAATLDNLFIKNSAYVYSAASSATATAVTITNNGVLDVRSGTAVNSGSQTYSGGFVLDSGGIFGAYAQNQDITIPASSTLVENLPGASRTYNNVTVNGTLTSGYNDSATSGTVSLNKVNWTINGNLTVSASGTISVIGKGYAPAQGPGAGGTSGTAGGGGGGGGMGGTSSTGGSGGSSYGSMTAPASMGSGGGNGQNANGQARGGGAIQLTVSATTTLSGTIVADGAAISNSDGAGGGGSIYLTTNVLTGSGSFSAKGANGSVSGGYGGGGGGGRIAIYYTTDSSSDSYSASGGSTVSSSANPGSPGTIYKKNPGQSYGDLIIDGNNIGGSTDTLIPLTPISSTTLDSITLQNSGGIYLSASSATTTILNLVNNGFYDARSGTRLNYTTLNVTTSAIVRDGGGGFPMIDQNQDMTIPANLTLVFNAPGSTRTYNNVTINGTLTTSYNNSATTSTPSSNLYKINWTVNGNLNVSSSGTVNVDGHGYTQDNGPGAGTPGSGAGGSYGGAGGTAGFSASTTVGSTYGSSTAPTDLGSGGSSASCSVEGAGGGSVEFNVAGNIAINGSISANGNPTSSNCGNTDGGGSGGSIYLSGLDFSGTGSISAAGGNGMISGSTAHISGGGGGGRIAVYLTSNPDNAVVRNVNGGFLTEPAEAGSSGSLVPQDQPTVSTQNPTSIADTSVIGNGTLTAINYYPITQHGFVIGSSSNPTLANAISSSALGVMSATGTFAGLLTGLTHDTNYHIRSYASTTGGVVYGGDVAFVTDDPAILTQVDYRFYKNNGQLQPAISVAGQDVPADIYATTTPIRLVMNMSATTDFLPAGVGQFKLQVSTATSTGWADVGGVEGSWWNTSWQNRRKIYFNNASSSTDLLNFPVLVSLNATSTANINYSETKAGGADIRFVASDNSTTLPYEIESWNSAATSTVWVKVPIIHASSTSDYIYLYYNNPSATDNSTTTGVWDSSYAGVWHFPSSNLTLDSSANSNTLGNHSGTTTSVGQVDGALSLGGSAYTTSSLKGITYNSPWTVSLWAKLNQSPGLLNLWSAVDSGNNFFGTCYWSSGDGGMVCTRGSGDSAHSSHIGGSININNFHLWTFTYDGSSNTMKILVDGVDETIQNTGGDYLSQVNTPTNNLSLSYGAGGGYMSQMTGDEFRISSTTRSTDYILAEYKTDSLQFNTYAAEESMSVVTAPSPFSFYGNSAVASGTTISSLLLSTSNVQETYEQSNPTAITPNQISVGQSGEWDFSVVPSYAIVNSTYYFRMVKSNGTALDFYSNYPSITLLPDNPPNAPSSLGPVSVTGGGYINIRSPSFTFNVTDPDATDTVQYDLQISTSSDFTGLITDYTSALQSQGAASFTMGQNAGSGSYGIGTSGQSLPDSSSGYYWRVLATDEDGVSSAFTSANGGAVAFKEDATAPNTGNLSVLPSSTTSLTASVANATDTTSGLAAAPYIFNNTTQGTNSGATSSASWLSLGLSVNTQYTFNVQVSDAADNSATGSNISAYTLANSPTSLATTSAAQTSIGFNWNGNNNPAGTNFILENITAGTSATTTATSTTYSGLACNTAYSFRVKALNGDGVSTSYSSTVTQSTSVCDSPPNVPSSLGPAIVVGGGYATSSTPSFSFNLSDPDLGDTVRYEIQISTTSNYSGLVLDYTSALQAQGAASFLVGQATGSGSYSTGSSATNLADSTSGYYWQVKAYDNGGLSSGYAQANYGAVAFNIDTTPAQQSGGNDGGGGTSSGSIIGSPIIQGPVGFGVSINGGQPATTDSSVNLFFNSEAGTSYLAVSNNPDFTGQSIIPYSPATTWNLCSALAPCDSGQHTVYVKFYSSSGQELGAGSSSIDIIPGVQMSYSPGTPPGVAQPQGLAYQVAPTPSIPVQATATPLTSMPSYSAKSFVTSHSGFITAIQNLSTAMTQSAGKVSAITAPAALILQFAILANGLNFNFPSLSDLWLIFLQLLNGLLTAIGLRKRRRYWGTVYDSVSKQPIDPAIVELIDIKSGKMVEQAITDLSGRFGFLDRPGQFTLNAKKTNYHFPSTIVLGKTDGLFTDLYHGEALTIKRAEDVISPNIPMDPLSFDWNQQDKKRLIKFNTARELTVYYIVMVLLWGGALAALLQLILHAGVVTVLIMLVYVLLLLLQWHLNRRLKLAGYIKSKSLKKLSGLLVEASPENIPGIVLGRAISDAGGKFFLKLPKGKFILRVKQGTGGAEKILYTTQTSMPENGVFNSNIRLD